MFEARAQSKEYWSAAEGDAVPRSIRQADVVSAVALAITRFGGRARRCSAIGDREGGHVADQKEAPPLRGRSS